MKTSSPLCFPVALLPAVFILLFGQCKKPGPFLQTIDPAFTETVAAFTSGTISCESVIQIVLAEDIVVQDLASAPSLKDVIRFKPQLQGQATWADKRTIVFRPDRPMPSGQQYTVRFRLSRILKVPKEIAVLAFRFNVVEQALNFNVEGYQSQNENDRVWNRINGTVNTADVIDNELIKTFFSATQEERMLPITWELSPDRRRFSFFIDSVKRTENPGKVVINWKGSMAYRGIHGQHTMEIPSLMDYKVMAVKVIQQPEQFIQIMFSDPIRKNQPFDGLIYLDNQASLEFSVTGNIIKAFPAVQQSGESRITIRDALANILGNTLKQDYRADLAFESQKPAVRLSGKGVILPTSRDMVFPFEAINLRAVDIKIIKIFENNIGHFLQVNRLDGSYQLKRAGRLIHQHTVSLDHAPADLGKWNRFHLDLAKFIKPDPGSIYRVEISFRRQYSLFPCADPNAEEETTGSRELEDGSMTDISYWDSYEEYYDDYYEDYGYDYVWEDRDNPCKPSYYRPGRWIARNILASDLGIVAKAGTDRKLQCAVTSLVTAQPLEGVEVTLYNFQQQPVATGKTDKSGWIVLDPEEKPFLLIARYERQRGYLRLDDGSSLSLGAFDVSGTSLPKGIKGFLYGERGVWRPGDTLFLTFMLEDRQHLLPPAHPVIFELYDPRGQFVNKTTRTSGLNGFYSWAVATLPDAPTGSWNLRVKVGGAQFNKSLRVETVKPNRLSMDLHFGADRLSVSRPDLSGMLTVSWLHGAVAPNLKASVAITLTQATTAFEKYPDYQFTDPSRSFNTEESLLFEGRTDSNGKIRIPCRITTERIAPGMLNVLFTTRVFEGSGEFSTDRTTLPYSPYEAYVGVKLPEGDQRGMLLTDTTHRVEVMLVDENGKLLSRPRLDAYVYKLDWRNWWESAGEELADFVGNTYNRPLITKSIAAVNGRGKFDFRIERPDWGRFYIRIIDPVSGHAAGKVVYIDWPGWAGRPMRDNPEAASMLTFNTDKSKYTVGETAEVIIPAGGKGIALFTLESGSRILEKKWLEVTGHEIRHRFTILPEMAPNVYACVTLIQPHANTENDMPMRLYGIIPILVEDPQTRLEPAIRMPDVLEPMQKVNIQVSEKNRREMTYTLALVEDGLLNLTRFKTPDPWKEFYAREALGVKTWDLYDEVIGAYGGKLAGMLGIGGDEELISDETGGKANRFMPVIRFLGPFALKAGETNQHSLVLPNYIGSVRAMVVAGNQGAYGFAEKTIPVRKPLMVLATLPRVLGPGESVSLPVTVFAMDPQVKQVNVTVRTGGLISMTGPGRQSVTFSQTGDRSIDFQLKTLSGTGTAKVQVTASSGSHIAAYEIELNVRNPNPPVTTFRSATLTGGKSWEEDLILPGMEGTNTAVLEVSGLPPVDIGRRLRYLIAYPHGCIEQITSAAFPQLFLSEFMELDQQSASTAASNVKEALLKLKSFQLPGGGFSYWPGNQSINGWGSSYAGHFILEAEKKGYAMPPGLKSGWISAQKQLARQWIPVTNKEIREQDDLEQAYRLFTLALAGEPETGAMNRLRESKNLSLQAKWRLAATYALTGQPAVGREIISRESTEIQDYRGFYSSYGSRERDWAMMLETMTLLNDQSRSAQLASSISGVLSSDNWMSTQTTAYCLLAMAKFARGQVTDKIEYTYQIGGGKSIAVSSSKTITMVKIPLGEATKSLPLRVTNQGKGVLFSRVMLEGIPEAGHEQTFSNNLILEVRYTGLAGDPLDVSRLLQGTDFRAVVTVYNPGLIDYQDMALTQIFPSGWEIRNNRLAAMEQPDGSDLPLYQDIRDDRVYSYFNLMRGERKSFVIQLSATYAGRYYLPGATCEAMYDNSISAMKQGAWIEVVRVGN